MSDIGRRTTAQTPRAPGKPASATHENGRGKPSAPAAKQRFKKKKISLRLEQKRQTTPDRRPKGPEPKREKLKVASRAEPFREGPHQVAAKPAREAEREAKQIASKGFNPQTFALNLSRIAEQLAKVTSAYVTPRLAGKQDAPRPDAFDDVNKTLGKVMEYWVSDPHRVFQMQARFGQAYIDLWTQSLQRMMMPLSAPAQSDTKDRRFADPEWSTNPFYDFVKQFYLMSSEFAEALVTEANGLDPHLKDKARFYVRQFNDAMSPTNFLFTNPVAMRETLQENGENLIRGLQMLAEDIEAGGGELQIRQSKSDAFEVGRNLAMTPGKVIFENDLMQLIQYDPTTKSVGKIPLLIIPPWINKFYILDLTPEKSFIKWCVDQGLTVFVMSWVNPDERHKDKGFEEYMNEGLLAALDVVRDITGEEKAHTIGYCVGGTMLAIALAHLAARREERVASATLFTAQVDFTHAGGLKVFVDEDQIARIEESMTRKGYLEGKKMAGAFNMLRSNDLIWSYAVNNYLLGKEPAPFDMLHWNSDSTRMPAANHSFYIRNCYLNNKLSKGEMIVDNVILDVGKIDVPIYNLATREDHIAPAKSVFLGSKFFGGDVKYVLAGSGHISGVVNPPAKNKYSFWTGGAPLGSLDTWLKNAKETPGSWWPDWRDWVKGHDAEKVPARKIGNAEYPPIEDAPGRYVRMKS